MKSFPVYDWKIDHPLYIYPKLKQSTRCLFVFHCSKSPVRESPHWKNALLHQIEVVEATPSESPGVPGKPENHLATQAVKSVNTKRNKREDSTVGSDMKHFWMLIS